MILWTITNWNTTTRKESINARWFQWKYREMQLTGSFGEVLKIIWFFQFEITFQIRHLPHSAMKVIAPCYLGFSIVIHHRWQYWLKFRHLAEGVHSSPLLYLCSLAAQTVRFKLQIYVQSSFTLELLKTFYLSALCWHIYFHSRYSRKDLFRSQLYTVLILISLFGYLKRHYNSVASII